MKTILIVEDDAPHRQVLTDLFKTICNVKCAGSLQEAQEILKNAQFDLILLDVHLPDGEGFKLVPHVFGQNELKTPILFYQEATKSTINSWRSH